MSSSFRLLLIILLPIAAHPADVHVPEVLQDWQAWVLQDKDYRDCPFFFNRGATFADGIQSFRIDIIQTIKHFLTGKNCGTGIRIGRK